MGVIGRLKLMNNEELIEIVFRACIIGGEYKSVTSATQENASPLTSISFGWANKEISAIIESPADITKDPMADVLLNYMMKDPGI